MIKVKIDEKKIDMISDFVSGVVNDNKKSNAFEGAYVCCSQGFSDLCVTLKLVTNGFNYKPVYSEEEMDRISADTGFDVKVERMSFHEFADDRLSNVFSHPEKGMLKSGNIIYDRNGCLAKLQSEYKADRDIDDLSWRGVVEVEPPIQYKKTM